MADNDILVSEMTTASQVNTNDLVMLTQPDALSETGYSTKKATALDVFDKFLDDTQYSTDLPSFTDKTIFGGMEELKADDEAMLPLETVTGTVVSFNTALTTPLKDCECDIPYSSNGYTGITVTKCGKNLFSFNLTIHNGYWSSSAYVGDDAILSLDQATGWDNIRIPVNEGDTITISGMQAQSGVYSAFLGSDDPSDVISRFLNATSNSTKMVPSGSKYLALCAYNMKLNAANYPNAQVEVGSSATAYAAYSSTTYSVSWQEEAGTIYGGSIDLTTGVLTSTYNADGTEKSTPDTYNLTPTEITPLSGYNTLFGNLDGNITVKVNDTIQHYTDKQLAGKANTSSLAAVATSGAYNDLSGKPTLATVATSGSYNDLTDKPSFTNITSSVTFNETTGGGTRFYYKDGALYLIYQSEAATHAANDLLFTLPSNYRPSATETIIPFIKNANAYGNVKITGTDGKCVVNTISANNGGRIYFNAVIPL